MLGLAVGAVSACRLWRKAWFTTSTTRGPISGGEVITFYITSQKLRPDERASVHEATCSRKSLMPSLPARFPLDIERRERERACVSVADLYAMRSRRTFDRRFSRLAGFAAAAATAAAAAANEISIRLGSIS